ncbi:MAG: hypothetical protein IJU37_07610 [Desulfovibrio sp.]|nr:hypothetical protein [Desulfovibrio sp.]
MPPVINNAADLIRNINAGSSFELTANNEIKKQGFFAKLLQSIGDAIWRSAEAIQERQANLDAAMADMLRGTESLPNLTQQNLLDAADKLPTAFESTLASIQSRLDIAQFPKGTKSIAQTILDKTEDAQAAKSVGTWKDSEQISAKDMQKFNAALKNEMNNYLKDVLRNGENFDTQEGISKQLMTDASREVITIKGKTYTGTGDNDERAINALKDVIQDPGARRLVSTLMCQTSLGSISTALSQGVLADEKGFVPQGLPKSNDTYMIGGGAATGLAEYSTNVAVQTSGGTPGHPEKATITLTQKLPIQLLEAKSNKLEDKLAGNVYVTLVQECTLGKHPSISDLKVNFSYLGPNDPAPNRDHIVEEPQGNDSAPILGQITGEFKQQLEQRLNAGLLKP